MRLIDADALKERFKSVDANGINLALDRYALKCIDDAPTIDAVKVVRCKNCKHGEQRVTANYVPFWYCNRNGRSIKDDYYCGYGERHEQ